MCIFIAGRILKFLTCICSAQFANGAVIVDPASGAVVARGCDGTGGWCGLQSGEEKPEILLHDGWHPLQHAVMGAIQMAAERDRREWPANDAKATMSGGDGGGNDCSDFSSHKRQRRSSEEVTVIIIYILQFSHIVHCMCIDMQVRIIANFRSQAAFMVLNWELTKEEEVVLIRFLR